MSTKWRYNQHHSSISLSNHVVPLCTWRIFEFNSKFMKTSRDGYNNAMSHGGIAPINCTLLCLVLQFWFSSYFGTDMTHVSCKKIGALWYNNISPSVAIHFSLCLRRNRNHVSYESRVSIVKKYDLKPRTFQSINILFHVNICLKQHNSEKLQHSKIGL